MPSKFIITALLTSLAWLCGYNLPAWAVEPGISIKPAKARYIVGEPIEIDIQITNNSESELACLCFYPGSLRPERGLIDFSDDMPVTIDKQYTPSLEASSQARIIAAQGTTTYKVFLQNFGVPIEVGEHQYFYSFNGSFREGPLDTGSSFRKNVRGSFGLHIDPDDDGQLDLALRSYTERMYGESHFAWAQQRLEALEAVRSVRTNKIVPHLLAVLKMMDLEEKYQVPNENEILKVLQRFQDDPLVRQTITSLITSDKNNVASSCMIWLSVNHVTIPNTLMEEALRKSINRGETPFLFLDYLIENPIEPTPGLRKMVLELLGDAIPSRDFFMMNRELRILFEWRVVRNPVIEQSLRIVTEDLEGLRSPDREWALARLSDWKISVNVAVVQKLWDLESTESPPDYKPILNYINTIRSKDYRELTPLVTKLLNADDEETTLLAMDYYQIFRIKYLPSQVDSLLDRDGAVTEKMRSQLDERSKR